MTMITPSYLGETIEYSSLHACRSTLEDPTASGPRAIRLQKALIGEWEALPVGAAIQRGIDCFASAWETDEPRGLMQRFLDHQRQRKR